MVQVKYFKGFLPQISRGLFLNTLSHFLLELLSGITEIADNYYLALQISKHIIQRLLVLFCRSDRTLVTKNLLWYYNRFF